MNKSHPNRKTVNYTTQLLGAGELGSDVLTEPAKSVIPKKTPWWRRFFMLNIKPRPKPRPAAFIALSVGLTLFWFVCVFYAQFNTFEHLVADKWWSPVFSPAFFIGATLSTLREQWLPFLGLGLFALTPLFRRAIDNKLLKGDFGRLFLVFCLLQALVLLQRYYIYTLPDDTSVMSYGLFLVVAAGLLGGRRLGVAVAIFNLFTSASLYIYNQAIEYENYLPPLTFFLTNPSVVAPLWVGWLAGYVSGYWPKWRFHWLTVTLLGVAGEVMITLTGIMASWTPAMYVYIFWHNLFTTPILLGGFLFLVYYRQNNSEEKLELTQSELALAEAELRALRAQINPHFMLNSLSVIHHLVRTQPDIARSLLLDLSDLFQHTLRAGDFVPLSKELEHVRAYLALEQARLTKRLNVMWAILAEDQLNTPVPTLILQPIIENAIVHGISPKPEGGTVSILVKQAGDDLHIQVVDNGVGFDTLAVPHPSHPERPSIGFKNIDMRLRLLYGEHYRIQVTSTPGAGTTVELRIPIKEASALEHLKELVNT